MNRKLLLIAAFCLYCFVLEVNSQTINIDSTFTTDGEIFPFAQVDSIYGLSLSGHVTLNSDTSLVRVILVDENYEEYMVYEAYPIIVNNLNYTVVDAGDETIYLNDVKPSSLIINTIDASIVLNHLSLRDTLIINADSLRYQEKLATDSIKSSNINNYIASHGWNWTAGQTNLTQMYYEQKKEMWGSKYNLRGLDYYTGGIYEYHLISDYTETTGTLIRDFDWRNRHNANKRHTSYFQDEDNPYWDGNPDNGESGNGWLTGIRHQRTCKSCWAFSTVAMVEAITNLYFNQHIDQVDGLRLSERHVLNCSGSTNNCGGGYSRHALNIFISDGVVNEECYEYEPPYWDNFSGNCALNTIICNDPDRQIMIEGEELLDDSSLSIRDIKINLIENGPLTVGLPESIFPQGPHSMLLIGFQYNYEDQETAWIFKNSWGLNTVNHGYITMYADVNKFYDINRVITPIYQTGNYSGVYDMNKCRDEDNDGWRNWGISNDSFVDCPEGTPDEIDSDDSNPRIGPFDDNYYGTPVAPKIAVKSGATNIPRDGFYSFGGTTYSVDFKIYNHGNAQLNLDEPFSQPNEGPIYISGTNADKFSITEADEPESNQIAMNSYQTFTIHYTGAPGETNIAEIKIELDEPDMDDFVFALVHTADDCPAVETIEDIRGTVTWSGYKFVDYGVRIPSGSILIIDGNVGFVEDAFITVGVGGELRIDGGNLTKACRLKFWKGVNVSGDNKSSQAIPGAQGIVRILNGGKIEYANVGIETMSNDDTPIAEHAGGIIYAENAVFKNNQADVRVFPYQNTHPVTGEPYRNLSYFTQCEFITTDGFYNVNPYDPQQLIAHLIMSGVDGLPIKACLFENSNLTQHDPTKRGDGIISFDAGFEVSFKKSLIPGEPNQRTIFRNLAYGVKAMSGRANPTVSVDSCYFENNWRGIYLSAIDFPEIIYNEFQLKSVDSIYDEADTIAGLYINDESVGYMVEENIFYNHEAYDPMTNNLKTVGIAVNSTGQYPNEIYNNDFERMDFGILAMKDNRGYETGLQIKCNDFIYCESDIAVTPENCDGIAAKQGANSTNPADMAGNLFYIPDPAPDGDFDDINNEGEHITYYYPSNAPEDGDRIRPVDYTTNSVTAYEVTVYPDWERDNGCPSHLELGGGGIEDLRSDMLLANQQIDSTENILTLLIDGGDTEEMQDDVEYSTPPETMDIYNDLMGESPYLSDTVVSTAIEKEDVLPNTMIRDVMVANPNTAKSNKLMDKLDERYDPMPDYMKAQILNGRSILSIREETEADLAGFKAGKAKAFNALMRHYRNDTLNPQASADSIMAMYQREDELWAKYALVFEYLAREDSTNAINTLDSIPVNYELSVNQLSAHQLYEDYVEIINNLSAEGKTLFQADSADKAELNSLHDNSKEKIHAQLRNLLVVIDSLTYQEPYIFPDLFKSGEANEDFLEIINTRQPAFLKVHPNPARDYVIIEYMQEMEGPGYIYITDLNGKPVTAYHVSDAYNQKVLDTRNWKAGIYIATLKINDKLVESVKFSITN